MMNLTKITLSVISLTIHLERIYLPWSK